jgi:DNA-binding GntR family transcriptional regulator
MPVLLKSKTEKEGEVDRVYRLLREAILQCELRPTEFLVEVDLARRCKTSRTPVREACNRLSQEGWIARIRYKGYLVAPISVRAIVELYEYRKLLECFTVAKAAEEATDEQIRVIAATIDVERGPRPASGELVQANEVFHLAVAAAAGNQRVLDQLKFTLEHVRRFDILSTQKEPGWVPHAEILKALELRNPTQARKAMANHIDISRDRMLKLFGG